MGTRLRVEILTGGSLPSWLETTHTQCNTSRTIGVVQDKPPVLLLVYNRPEQMRGLIRSLAALKPKLILLSVDGPKMYRLKDVELVRQTQEMVNEIT